MKKNNKKTAQLNSIQILAKSATGADRQLTSKSVTYVILHMCDLFGISIHFCWWCYMNYSNGKIVLYQNTTECISCWLTFKKLEKIYKIIKNTTYKVKTSAIIYCKVKTLIGYNVLHLSMCSTTHKVSRTLISTLFWGHQTKMKIIEKAIRPLVIKVNDTLDTFLMQCQISFFELDTSARFPNKHFETELTVTSTLNTDPNVWIQF